MSVQALAHELIAASGIHSGGGVLVPNPAPAPPTGLTTQASLALSWLKWLGIVFGVGALIFCGIKVMAGRHGRSNTGAEGVTGIGWVIAGLTVIALSAGIVRAFA
jgi:hypothetical protein